MQQRDHYPIYESPIDVALDRLTNSILSIHPKILFAAAGAASAMGMFVIATTSLQNIDVFSYFLGVFDGIILTSAINYFLFKYLLQSEQLLIPRV